ncbi:TPA: XkdX family protein [Clostridioides difficile]
MWYKIIKKYYDDKLWSKEQVKTAVEKNKITTIEYKNIIGEDYIA